MAYSKKQVAVHGRIIMQFLSGADIARYNPKTEKWEHTAEPSFDAGERFTALNTVVATADGVYEKTGIVVMGADAVKAANQPHPIVNFISSLFEHGTMADDSDETLDHADDCPGCPDCKPVDVTTDNTPDVAETEDPRAPAPVEAPAEEEAEVEADAPVVEDTPESDAQDAVAPAPTEVPEKFVRGDVWESREGRNYLILGDKAKLDPNYTGSKCKEAQIVVLRLKDDGTTELSHRNPDGTRTFLKSGKPNKKRDLIKKIDTRKMRAVGGANQLIRRTGSPDIYYDASLEESRLVDQKSK